MSLPPTVISGSEPPVCFVFKRGVNCCDVSFVDNWFGNVSGLFECELCCDTDDSFASPFVHSWRCYAATTNFVSSSKKSLCSDDHNCPVADCFWLCFASSGPLPSASFSSRFPAPQPTHPPRLPLSVPASDRVFSRWCQPN